MPYPSLQPAQTKATPHPPQGSHHPRGQAAPPPPGYTASPLASSPTTPCAAPNHATLVAPAAACHHLAGWLVPAAGLGQGQAASTPVVGCPKEHPGEPGPSCRCPANRGSNRPMAACQGTPAGPGLCISPPPCSGGALGAWPNKGWPPTLVWPTV